MTYRLRPKTMYMMPTHFGPMSGPRQDPNGNMGVFDNDDRDTESLSVSFLSRADQLEDMLPDRFCLVGDPVVTVTANYMTNIGWLAGRGYAILSVTFNAGFQGAKEYVEGPFMAVLWENMTEPILTGREQLGFSKIFCELPNPIRDNGVVNCKASWDGFQFFEMKISDLSTVKLSDQEQPASLPKNKQSQGTLHYKYIPRTGVWGEVDAEYTVLTPRDSSRTIVDQSVGVGSVEFRPTTWDDMPTQCMIVNTLSRLEIVEYRAASIVRTKGARDLLNQRIVE